MQIACHAEHVAQNLFKSNFANLIEDQAPGRRLYVEKKRLIEPGRPLVVAGIRPENFELQAIEHVPALGDSLQLIKSMACGEYGQFEATNFSAHIEFQDLSDFFEAQRKALEDHIQTINQGNPNSLRVVTDVGTCPELLSITASSEEQLIGLFEWIREQLPEVALMGVTLAVSNAVQKPSVQ